MRPTLTLLASALRRDRTPLLALASLLFLFQLLLVTIMPEVENLRVDLLAEMVPSFIRNSIGFDITLLFRIEGAIGLGYFHPLVLTMLVTAAVVVGRGPVSEVEGRTVELLLARPVARRAIASASLLQAALVATTLPLMILAGTCSGLVLIGLWGTISLQPYLTLCGNAMALTLAWGALAVLLATLCSRVRTYTLLAVGLAITTYLLDFVARGWAPIASLGRLSPFRYLSPLKALTGQSILTEVGVLLGLALVSAVAAATAFSRRDL